MSPRPATPAVAGHLYLCRPPWATKRRVAFLPHFSRQLEKTARPLLAGLFFRGVAVYESRNYQVAPSRLREGSAPQSRFGAERERRAGAFVEADRDHRARECHRVAP